MKTDTYTKVILTIIAIALTLNLAKSFITPAQADARKYVTVPIKADGTIDVNIKSITTEKFAFDFSAPIPVTIKKDH